ncbi:hypothetical protein D3C83_194130 [compost metagenome]
MGANELLAAGAARFTLSAVRIELEAEIPPFAECVAIVAETGAAGIQSFAQNGDDVAVQLVALCARDLVR